MQRRFLNGALKTETWTESVIKLLVHCGLLPLTLASGLPLPHVDNFSMQHLITRLWLAVRAGG